MNIEHLGWRRRWVTLACVLAMGCATSGSPLADGRGGSASLAVTSSHYHDVTIYLMLDGSWLRLGTVSGPTSERFEIPESALLRPGGFRLLAEAIGSSAAYLSDRILANPGDTVRLQLASVLSMSSWSVGSAEDTSSSDGGGSRLRRGPAAPR